jgi:RNA polymerase sigma-70 factor (ECF subfamily)
VDVEAEIRSAWDRRDFDGAATAALAAYGRELASYLAAVLRNAADADDVLAQVAEQLWKALPTFRWECTIRTFVYTLARHAWLRHVREPKRERVSLSSPSVEVVVAKARSETAEYLRTAARDRINALRAALDPDDQSLLILRVDRGLAWREVARVMPEGEDDLDKRAAALRKRFERLKRELRAAYDA